MEELYLTMLCRIEEGGQRARGHAVIERWVDSPGLPVGYNLTSFVIDLENLSS